MENTKLNIGIVFFQITAIKKEEQQKNKLFWIILNLRMTTKSQD